MTLPSLINLSAPRLDVFPDSLMYLLSRRLIASFYLDLKKIYVEEFNYNGNEANKKGDEMVFSIYFRGLFCFYTVYLMRKVLFLVN